MRLPAQPRREKRAGREPSCGWVLSQTAKAARAVSRPPFLNTPRQGARKQVKRKTTRSCQANGMLHVLFVVLLKLAHAIWAATISAGSTRRQRRLRQLRRPGRQPGRDCRRSRDASLPGLLAPCAFPSPSTSRANEVEQARARARVQARGCDGRRPGREPWRRRRRGEGF